MCYKRDLMCDLFIIKFFKVCKWEINYGFLFYLDLNIYCLFDKIWGN